MLPRRPILRAALLFAAGAALISFYLLAVNLTRAMPRCIIHAITGLQCPGCGSQRALHAILGGDIAGAVSANFLLPFLLLYLLVLAARWINPSSPRVGRLYSRLTSPLALRILLALILLWFILRNIIHC